MVAAQLVFHHHPPSLIDDLEARAWKLGKDLSTIDLDAITLPVGVDFDIAR
jgi:translation initiation factor 3 subunit B